MFDFWIVVPAPNVTGWKDSRRWDELEQFLSSKGRVTLNFRTGRNKSAGAGQEGSGSGMGANHAAEGGIAAHKSTP